MTFLPYFAREKSECRGRMYAAPECERHPRAVGPAMLGVAALLSGCSAPLLNPKGSVGESELFVIGAGFALMLIVVIPVVIMAFWFPWRYAATKRRGDYAPRWSHSVRLEMVVWLVPAAIVIALGILGWRETHRLDPFQPLAAAAPPLDVEVVSMDWKWLFIYPQQNLATVNELVLPVNVPVRFTLTSDSVVTSFFIPQLGSQIYAMAGMKSRLHLLAAEPGTYAGQNEQFSGKGFAKMRFSVIAMPQDKFKDWVRQARLATDRLDLVRFQALQKPGVEPAPTIFSFVEPGLFDRIVAGYHSREGKPGEAAH